MEIEPSPFNLVQQRNSVIVIGQHEDTAHIYLILQKVTYICEPRMHADICFTKFVNLWAKDKKRAMIYIMNNCDIRTDERTYNPQAISLRDF